MAKKNLNIDMTLGIIIVLIFVGFSYTGLSIFEVMERTVYDAEMRFIHAEKRADNKIALIEIDDKSLTMLGPWPWPRNYIAEMIDILKGDGVKLICPYLPFFEKEPNQGLREVKAFREKFDVYPLKNDHAPIKVWILDNLKQMEENLDNDQRLVNSVQQSGNVILPAFTRPESDQKRAARGRDPLLYDNALTEQKISASLKKKLSISQLSLPFAELAQIVLGLGYGSLTPEEGMGGRSYPMFFSYKGSLLPSFPLRIAISYLNQQPEQVNVEENQILLKDSSIPLINGEMLIKFKNGQNAFHRYSFVDVLEAKKIPPALKGKIILIGLNLSKNRGISTPISSNMSEIELIAHILENTINKSHIIRPHIIGFIEILAIFLLGGLASFIFPRMGQLSRLALWAGLIALTLMTGAVLFSMMDLWFKTVYISGCLITIYLVVSVRQLFTAERITKESVKTNRLLGLSFQSQGLLDLAFDKFRKLPLDDDAKDLMYNLGLEYEQKRMINKALSAYEYINKKGGFRDLDDRIPKLKESDKSSTIGSHGAAKEARILSDLETKDRSKVGRYEIIEELGKGSMGLVYKALDPKINRSLAIKTIRFSDEFDEDVIQEIKERFFREAEIAGQLSHPSIVTIYDVGEDRDLTYMAMEFLKGEDLEKYTDKKNLLPLRKVLDVAARVADALDFAHKSEVIHRDIKPANIMLLKNGGVKVTDFGIAKAISSSRTRTGVILGTPNYMSPEQIIGQKIDARSDIFSLGVLFYQLLTGELPFHGDNLSSLLYQITQVKHPPVRNHNPKIPRACEQIIDRALAKNPKERFGTAGEMAKIISLFVSKVDQLRKSRERA